jgi:hypothetical protein
MIFSDKYDALNSPLHGAGEMASLTFCQMLLQSSDLVAAARSWIPISCTLFCHHTFAKSHTRICKSRGSIFFSPLSTLAKLSRPISGITTHLIGCPVRSTCLSLAASGSAGLLERTYAGLASTIYTFASTSGSRLRRISQPRTLK